MSNQCKILAFEGSEHTTLYQKLRQLWYHATDKKIKGNFMPGRGAWGTGIYLSTLKGVQDVYGKYIHKLKVSVRNPYVIEGGMYSDIRNRIEEGTLSEDEVTNHLEEQGYDSIYIKPTGFEEPILVVFYGEDIKYAE